MKIILWLSLHHRLTHQGEIVDPGSSGEDMPGELEVINVRCSESKN
jgi:hypothetical protein